MKQIVIGLSLIFSMLFSLSVFAAEDDYADSNVVILDPYAYFEEHDDAAGRIEKNNNYALTDIDPEKSVSGYSYGKRPRVYKAGAIARATAQMAYYPRLAAGEYMVYMCTNAFDNENYSRTGFIYNAEVGQGAEVDANWGYFGGQTPAFMAQIVTDAEGYKWFPIGTYAFSGSGEEYIRVFNNVNGVRSYADALKFVKSEQPAYEGMRVNGKMVSGDVDCGADRLVLCFSNDLGAAEKAEISITDDTGNIVSCQAQVSNKTLTLDLYQALKPETAYTIAIHGLKDISGVYEVNEQIVFAASSQSLLKTASISDGKVVEQSGEYVASGSVIGSHQMGIQGRPVILEIVPEDGGQRVRVASGVSGENGSFSIAFTVPEELESGQYDIVAHVDCGVDDDYSIGRISYLDQADVAAYLSGFARLTTAAQVEVYFQSIAEAIGLPFDVDMATLTELEREAFLCAFAGKTFLSYGSFRSYYDGLLVLYELNRAQTVQELQGILDDIDKCVLLQIDARIYALLDEEKTLLLEGILGAGTFESTTAFADFYTKTALALALQKFEITPPVTSIANAKAQKGQKLVLDLQENETNHLKKVMYVLMAEDDWEIFEQWSVEGGSWVQNGRELCITFDYEHPEIDRRQLCLIMGDAFPTQFAVRYTVQYIYDADGKELEYSIAERQFLLEKTAGSTGGKDSRPMFPGRGGGSGGGSKSSGGAAIVSPPVVTDPVEQKPENPNPFVDIDSVEWAKDSIVALYQRGIVKGMTAHTFAPGEYMTREQFCALIARAFQYSTAGVDCEFTDVVKDDWFYGEVSACVENGVIRGFTDGSFGTGRPLTREDMAVIIANSMGDERLPAYNGEKFSDDAQIAAYAQEAVYRLKAAGVISGIGGNAFSPKETVTRAMAAKTIYFAVQAVDGESIGEVRK